MADELEDVIGSILSDPAQMERISSLAQSILGNSAKEIVLDDPAPAEPGFPGLVKSVMHGGGESSSEALLHAMRPYMRPERQSKIDKALRLTRMLHLAGIVMTQYGSLLDGV